jgi:hypothetical protein
MTACTAQKAQEIPGVKYPVGNTPWCIPTFGEFLALFGVFRDEIPQSPSVWGISYGVSQSNSTYTALSPYKLMPPVHSLDLVLVCCKCPRDGLLGVSAGAARAARAWRGMPAKRGAHHQAQVPFTKQETCLAPGICPHKAQAGRGSRGAFLHHRARRRLTGDAASERETEMRLPTSEPTRIPGGANARLPN